MEDKLILALGVDTGGIEIYNEGDCPK